MGRSGAATVFRFDFLVFCFIFFPHATQRPSSWSPHPIVLTVIVGVFLVGTCAFAGVVGWKIAADLDRAFLIDLDTYMAATLYASFVSLGLGFSAMLFVNALIGWFHLRRKGVSPFVLQSLFKLVVVALGIFAGFGFALVFALLRVPVFPIVAPLWAFMAFGVILPLCFVLASMSFFVANAVFSESLRAKSRSGLIPLLEEKEKSIPRAYEI